jgi:hypothetical protein
MNWFLAKIIYQIICGDGDHTAQFDEQLRLINATSPLQAFYKAKRIGTDEEDNFLNDVNKPVRWKFIDVAEIYPLNQLTDGVEIYSKITEEDNPDAYVSTIKLRAEHLVEAANYQSPVLN